MAHAFRPHPDGTISCKLEGDEKAIIAQVAQEVAELIRQDLHLAQEAPPVQAAAASDDPLERLEAEFASTSAPAPTDSGVRRLLPDASEDPELAAEYRRFSQRDLAGEKLHDLGRMARRLDASGPGKSEVTLEAEETVVWLRGLNDLRLVLADRLSITHDGEFETLRMLQEISEGVEELEAQEEDDDGDVAGPDVVAAVYELLTWLLDSLVRALDEY